LANADLCQESDFSVKIIDLGLAESFSKIASDQEEKLCASVGTPLYISPQIL